MATAPRQPAQSHPSRQVRMLKLVLQPPDCGELLALGLIRADLLWVKRDWFMRSEPLFHSMVIVRRGQLTIRHERGGAIGMEPTLDASLPGILRTRAGPCTLVATGDFPEDRNGASHELVRIRIDSELVHLADHVHALPAEGRQLGDAISGLAFTSLDEQPAAIRARQAWVTAAVEAARGCWQALGLGIDARISGDLRHLLGSINDAPDYPWSVGEMAQRLGCSPTHVGRRFALAGLGSPMHEVNRLRMLRAERLLAFTRYKLKDVAWRCGFANPFSLSRAFTRHFGHSPRSHRKQA